MKAILNWQSPEVANIFDEATLWSAPFGRLLLENIPMKAKSRILDIGFGTGFPLIELSQRFGEDSQIYGQDIWPAGIALAKGKIRVMELNNIEIFEQDACSIPLENDSLDLICSNLGVNNFAEKDQVLQETFRVLKPQGHLCITSNPIGTFDALFDLFLEVLEAMNRQEEVNALNSYLAHRGTRESIIAETEAVGYRVNKVVADQTNMRFCNAAAIFDHALMRIGFRESWEKMIPQAYHAPFFEQVLQKIENRIQQKGEFQIDIPMLYLEFVKP